MRHLKALALGLLILGFGNGLFFAARDGAAEIAASWRDGWLAMAWPLAPYAIVGLALGWALGMLALRWLQRGAR